MASDLSDGEAYHHEAGNDNSINDIVREETHDGVAAASKLLGWQPSKLCSYCQAIADDWPPFDTEWKKKWTFTHYDNNADLEKSAASGCKLCAQFVRGKWEGSVYEDAQFKHGLVRISSPHPSMAPVKGLGTFMELLHVCGSMEMSEEGDKEVFVHTVYAVSSQRGEERVAFPRRQESSTSDGLPLAVKWLESCCDNHFCTPYERHTPTRLIDITRAPCVCWGKDIGTYVDYATLSHCWGDLKLPTLTKNTLAQYCHTIPNSALSKTFQEAIYITRALGMKYLWIDSLCIIQDDVSDWQRESALMTNVYGSAKINIAASGAPDGAHGCFFPRKAAWRCQLEVSQKFDTPVPKFNEFVECFTKKSLRELDNMPLATRGWALQERLISPRTLFLARSQLFWQCRTTERCEIFPEGLNGSSELCYGGRIDIELEEWWAIVGQYSQCHITYSRDKLVALSGIAKKINQRTNDQYVAGLWRENIESHLCWHIKLPLAEVPEYRAPTWSWASVDGAVQNYFLGLSGKDKKLARVLRVHLVHKVLGDSFWEVSEGSIWLECGNLLQGAVMPLNVKSPGLSTVTLRIPRFGYEEIAWVDFDHIEAKGGSDGIGTFVLPVLDFEHRGSGRYEGLLLRQTGARPGEYKRMGYFEINEWHTPKDAFKKMLKADIAAEVYGWPERADQYRELFAEVNVTERKDGNIDIQKVIVVV